jgi:hypothetical protein
MWKVKDEFGLSEDPLKALMDDGSIVRCPLHNLAKGPIKLDRAIDQRVDMPRFVS